ALTLYHDAEAAGARDHEHRADEPPAPARRQTERPRLAEQSRTAVHHDAADRAVRRTVRREGEDGVRATAAETAAAQRDRLRVGRGDRDERAVEVVAGAVRVVAVP